MRGPPRQMVDMWRQERVGIEEPWKSSHLFPILLDWARQVWESVSLRILLEQMLHNDPVATVTSQGDAIIQ